MVRDGAPDSTSALPGLRLLTMRISGVLGAAARKAKGWFYFISDSRAA
jgi:hypothetical protein